MSDTCVSIEQKNISGIRAANPQHIGNGYLILILTERQDPG